MTHRKLGTIKSKIRTYDVAELRALLIFIQALLGSMPRKRRAGAGRTRHSGAKKHHKGRHLSAGIHHVRVKMKGGGSRMRKVRVLASGKWQFMKG